MQLAKPLVGSFLVGGAFCAVAEAVMVAVGHVGPIADAGAVPVVTLLVMGVVGAGLTVAGVFPRLLAVGGMGAAMTFSGLVATVAGVVLEEGVRTRSLRKGVSASFLVVGVGVLGIGLVADVAFALFYHAGEVLRFTVPYSMAGQDGPMVGSAWAGIVASFVVGGVLGSFATAIVVVTRIQPRVFVAGAFVLGGLLVPTGAMTALGSAGGMGSAFYTLGGGETVVSVFTAFRVGADRHTFPELVVVLGCLYLLGVLSAAVVWRRAGADAAAADELLQIAELGAALDAQAAEITTSATVVVEDTVDS